MLIFMNSVWKRLTCRAWCKSLLMVVLAAPMASRVKALSIASMCRARVVYRGNLSPELSTSCREPPPLLTAVSAISSRLNNIVTRFRDPTTKLPVLPTFTKNIPRVKEQNTFLFNEIRLHMAEMFKVMYEKRQVCSKQAVFKAIT